MNRIPIALFSARAAAEPMRQRLAQAGILAELREEVFLQKLWFISKESAGVQLEVPENQFEQAERLLRAWDAEEEGMRQAIRCPECKSFLVDYPQFARNSLLTNVAAGLMAELGLVERDYYCEHCHFTWPKERANPARSRSHLAPYYFIERVQATVLPSRANPASVPDVTRRAR